MVCIVIRLGFTLFPQNTLARYWVPGRNPLKSYQSTSSPATSPRIHIIRIAVFIESRFLIKLIANKSFSFLCSPRKWRRRRGREQWGRSIEIVKNEAVKKNYSGLLGRRWSNFACENHLNTSKESEIQVAFFPMSHLHFDLPLFCARFISVFAVAYSILSLGSW